MLPRPWICLLAACLLAARGISAAESPVNSIAQNPLPELVGTVAARHGLPLGGTWQVIAPERVVLTPGEVDVAVTLYGLRDTSGLRALLLVQRNVLPGASGWGPPSACAGGGNPLLRLDVYHSPRDVLCGWAEQIVSTPQARLTPLAYAALGDTAGALAARTDRWVLIGWRVSNRNDFLDLQLLVPDRAGGDGLRQFVADVAHSLDVTWLSGAPSAVPMPPPPPPAAPEQAGSWWDSTLSTSVMRTATYRVGVSIKTFAVASLMAGNAATGGAIIAVLNVTSTGVYLLNDYIWETFHPLSPSPQDFLRLVDARQ
jgi:uncharacterized membrane protein